MKEKNSFTNKKVRIKYKQERKEKTQEIWGYAYIYWTPFVHLFILFINRGVCLRKQNSTNRAKRRKYKCVGEIWTRIWLALFVKWITLIVEILYCDFNMVCNYEYCLQMFAMFTICYWESMFLLCSLFIFFLIARHLFSSLWESRDWFTFFDLAFRSPWIN